MFFTKTRATKSGSADVSARARAAGQAAQVAAQNAQVAAQSAAQNAAVAARTAATAAQATAQTAASGVSSGVQQGVYTARRWTAPRLELAAEHVTKTVAPTVSSALRSTARQVKPAEPAKRRTASALTWSLLGAAILAGAGAAFALIRYQLRAATADETVEVGEATDMSGRPPTAGPAAPAAPNGATGTTAANSPSGSSGSSASAAKTSADKGAASKTAASKTADDAPATTTDTSVNGHVTSSGW